MMLLLVSARTVTDWGEGWGEGLAANGGGGGLWEGVMVTCVDTALSLRFAGVGAFDGFTGHEPAGHVALWCPCCFSAKRASWGVP